MRTRWLERSFAVVTLDVDLRSSKRGNHQLAVPSSSIVDGTSTIRTIVASMSTATARPRRPNIFRDRSSPSTKAANTQNMFSAAAVVTRAVIVRP